MEGTGAVAVYFLQKAHVRLQLCGCLFNTGKIAPDSLSVCRHNALSAVHEEIRVIAERPVSAVPGHHLKGNARIDGITGPGADCHMFSLLRPVLRQRQIFEKTREQDCREQEHRQQKPQYFGGGTFVPGPGICIVRFILFVFLIHFPPHWLNIFISLYIRGITHASHPAMKMTRCFFFKMIAANSRIMALGQ